MMTIHPKLPPINDTDFSSPAWQRFFLASNDPTHVGAWTPTFRLSTPGTSSFGTYTTQSGFFVRVGALLFMFGEIIAGNFTLGTGSGTLEIAGIPAQSVWGSEQPLAIGWASGFTTLTPTYAAIPSFHSGLILYNKDAAGASTQITAANCGNTMTLRFSGVYAT